MRATPVVLRAVPDLAVIDAQAGLLVRHQVAAGDVERRIEEPPDRIERRRLGHDGIVDVPTGGRMRLQQPGERIEQMEGDLLETERGLDAATDRPQDLVGRLGRGQRRRDLEQLFQPGAVSCRARRLLRGFDRDRSVAG